MNKVLLVLAALISFAVSAQAADVRTDVGYTVDKAYVAEVATVNAPREAALPDGDGITAIASDSERIQGANLFQENSGSGHDVADNRYQVYLRIGWAGA